MEGHTRVNTPKRNILPCAASTAYKSNNPKQRIEDGLNLSQSLGLLSLNSLNGSSFGDIDKQNVTDVDYHSTLQQQRLLANETLERANKVNKIPSKYLKPDFTKSEFLVNSESTISESDLLLTPKNTSTPRTSEVLGEIEVSQPSRLSYVDAMAHVSKIVSNPDIKLDNVFEEFQKAVRESDAHSSGMRSSMFIPAEDAASKLLADENSWRRKNDIQMTEIHSLQESCSSKDKPSVSISEFFQQRSDNISDLKTALSPQKTKKPVALVDSSYSFVEENSKTKDSLSATAIARMLSETANSPGKVLNYLYKGDRNNKHETSRKSDFSDEGSLPVSRNISYTSNFSSNEAITRAQNKENIDTQNLPKTSVLHKPLIKDNRTPSPLSSTGRSSSSMTSLTDGKLPIDSSYNELVWGCVRVDRCVTKEFILRNKSPKNIRIHCTMSGQQFKLRKENRQDSEPMSTWKFVLHAHESRPISVSFAPTKIGAAYDELCFLPLDPHLQQTRRQFIKLCGYGGNVNLELQSIAKDTSGKFWLSLGRIGNMTFIEQSFVVRNTGTLPAFVYVSFTPKQICSFTNLEITPSIAILLPNEEKSITVQCEPSAGDFRLLQECLNKVTLTEIGTLDVVSGSEVNRGRLRRLWTKCEKKGIPISPLSQFLRQKIKGEVIPVDISKLKESTGATKHILETFVCEKVVLTLEQDPDQTIVPNYVDDSAMFQSLSHEHTMANNTSVFLGSCRLEPSNLILSPPTKIEDCLYLSSSMGKEVMFEATSTPADLEIQPSVGKLGPGDTVLLKVKCSQCSLGKSYKVLVDVDDEILEADVKIIVIPRKDFLG